MTSRILFFVLLIFISPAVMAAEIGVIGTVVEAEGAASVGNRHAAPDLPVREGEVLQTGAGARLVVLFIDDTQLILSEKTRVTVNDYIFNESAPEGNRAAYSILNGAFLYVSGLIGPGARVETPAGSIGVRGTQFWGGMLDGQYGVLVTEGRVALSAATGETEINAGLGVFSRGRIFAPSAPAAWAEEKKTRAVATVALKRPQAVQQRLAAVRAAHVMRRQSFKGVLERRQNNEIRRNSPKPSQMRQRVKPSQMRPVVKPTDRY
jgi:hypothetical protein